MAIAGLVALCVASGHSLACAQAVRVALTPVDSVIAPGSEFVMRIAVTQAGPAFNGYEAVIDFDPTALSFVPVLPVSQQEGSYMRSVCGNTYHRFHPPAGSDSLKVTHVLLCGGPTLTGPGVLYKLRFRAAAQPRTTRVEFRRIEFTNGGPLIPVLPTNSRISIGSPTDAGSPGVGAAGTRLRISPNPFNPATVVQVMTAADGFQSLVVHDAAGRRVRLLQQGRFGPGSRLVAWDGRNDGGLRLSSGVYVVTLRASGQSMSERVVLLK